MASADVTPAARQALFTQFLQPALDNPEFFACDKLNVMPTFVRVRAVAPAAAPAPAPPPFTKEAVKSAIEAAKAASSHQTAPKVVFEMLPSTRPVDANNPPPRARVRRRIVNPGAPRAQAPVNPSSAGTVPLSLVHGLTAAAKLSKTLSAASDSTLGSWVDEGENKAAAGSPEPASFMALQAAAAQTARPSWPNLRARPTELSALLFADSKPADLDRLLYRLPHITSALESPEVTVAAPRAPFLPKRRLIVHGRQSGMEAGVGLVH